MSAELVSPTLTQTWIISLLAYCFSQTPILQTLLGPEILLITSNRASVLLNMGGLILGKMDMEVPNM